MLCSSIENQKSIAHMLTVMLSLLEQLGYSGLIFSWQISVFGQNLKAALFHLCFVHFRYVYGFSVWAHFTLGHQTTCLAPTQLDHSQNGKIPTGYQWRFLIMSKQVFYIIFILRFFLFHEWISVFSRKEFSTWNNGVFLKITFL